MVQQKQKQKIKELTKATIRCIPMDNKKEDGICVYTGNHQYKECFLQKLIKNFFKKIYIGIATFKNSCIFASAMETL